MNRSDTFDAMRVAWLTLQERLGAYALVLPGSEGFACLTTSCPAHCCYRYTVSLGPGEVERMTQHSGLPPAEFLESEDGVPIELPLAEPYVLARDDGHCALLRTEDLLCGQHTGRPNACRLYPHFIVAFDSSAGRLRFAEPDELRAAVERAIAGDFEPELLPVLVRHLDCPGFGGPPVSDDEWPALYRRIAMLQYPLEGDVVA